jgi:hypothetical protein
MQLCYNIILKDSRLGYCLGHDAQRLAMTDKSNLSAANTQPVLSCTIIGNRNPFTQLDTKPGSPDC